MRFLAPFFLLIISTDAEILSSIDPFEPVPDGKTVVWSPLFQASWDAMNKEFGGKPNRVEPPDKLMKRLDSFQWTASDTMPVEGWKVWGGRATAEFLERVERESIARAGGGGKPFEVGEVSPDSVASFGLLMRNVEFKRRFYESKAVALLFKAVGRARPVRFFGTNGKMSAQYDSSVRVLGYSPDWHAIECASKDTDEKVVFYLPAEKQDFSGACKAINSLRKDRGPQLGRFRNLRSGDKVCIPYVSLKVKSTFGDQLLGKRYYGIDGDPWAVGAAWQNTVFNLSEKGAQVEVSAGANLEPFGEAPRPVKPRNFVFDRPFFVFMWRDGAEWPYLGLWIGNDSALSEF